MAEPLLIDTDVLVDYLRGQVDAVAYLENLNEPVHVLVITQAELYAGVREGPERNRLDTLISVLDIVVITPEIARNGGLYRRDYGRSHGVGLADALIAASAESCSATLVTLNRKHFPMLNRVVVPYIKH